MELQAIDNELRTAQEYAQNYPIEGLMETIKFYQNKLSELADKERLLCETEKFDASDLRYIYEVAELKIAESDVLEKNNFFEYYKRGVNSDLELIKVMDADVIFDPEHSHNELKNLENACRALDVRSNLFSMASRNLLCKDSDYILKHNETELDKVQSKKQLDNEEAGRKDRINKLNERNDQLQSELNTEQQSELNTEQQSELNTEQQSKLDTVQLKEKRDKAIAGLKDRIIKLNERNEQLRSELNEAGTDPTECELLGRLRVAVYRDPYNTLPVLKTFLDYYNYKHKKDHPNDDGMGDESKYLLHMMEISKFREREKLLDRNNNIVLGPRKSFIDGMPLVEYHPNYPIMEEYEKQFSNITGDAFKLTKSDQGIRACLCILHRDEMHSWGEPSDIKFPKLITEDPEAKRLGTQEEQLARLEESVKQGFEELDKNGSRKAVDSKRTVHVFFDQGIHYLENSKKWTREQKEQINFLNKVAKGIVHLTDQSVLAESNPVFTSNVINNMGSVGYNMKYWVNQAVGIFIAEALMRMEIAQFEEGKEEVIELNQFLRKDLGMDGTGVDRFAKARLERNINAGGSVVAAEIDQLKEMFGSNGESTFDKISEQIKNAEAEWQKAANKLQLVLNSQKQQNEEQAPSLDQAKNANNDVKKPAKLDPGTQERLKENADQVDLNDVEGVTLTQSDLNMVQSGIWSRERDRNEVEGAMYICRQYCDCADRYCKGLRRDTQVWNMVAAELENKMKTEKNSDANQNGPEDGTRMPTDINKISQQFQTSKTNNTQTTARPHFQAQTDSTQKPNTKQ